MNIPKKQIIFVENGTTDMLSKIAYVLRKRGYETILISLIGNLEKDFLIDAYDKRISFDLKFFRINMINFPKIVFYCFRKIWNIAIAINSMRKIRPLVLLTRSNPSWMCMLFKFFFSKRPFIYFPYDIRSSSYTDLNQMKLDGIPFFEIMAERYCFKNADGIIHKGSESELSNLNNKILGKDLKITCPQIYFFPYCLDEFMISITNNKLSKSKNDINLVFAGTIPANSEWNSILELLVKQKINFHYYGKTSNLSKEEEKKRIKESFNSVINSKFFHVHDTVNQKELAKELSKYDFGIFTFDIYNKSEKTSTGNKFSSYLEAGIPIINLKSFETLAELIDRYGIGINVSLDDISKLREIIKSKKYNNFLKNIPRARHELSMEKNIPRLEKFFMESVKHKHNH